MWNVSRTQSEVNDTWKRILNSTEVANPNLIGYWRFDDGSGIYAHDYSIQGNDGVLLPYPDPPQWISDTSPPVPEFPSFLILPLFIMASLLAVIVYRRKHTV